LLYRVSVTKGSLLLIDSWSEQGERTTKAKHILTSFCNSWESQTARFICCFHFASYIRYTLSNLNVSMCKVLYTMHIIYLLCDNV